MRFNTSYWKRLLANKASDAAVTTVLREILDIHTLSDIDLEQISVRNYSYGSERQLRLPTPNYIGEIPEEITGLSGSHCVTQWEVYEIQDVNLVGSDALTIAENGKLVLANYLNSHPLLLREILKFFWRGEIMNYRSEPDEKINLAICLVGPWANGFFHWFAEYLPRLEGLKHFETRTGEEPVLIIPNDPPDWMTDSLSLLGYGPDRIKEWSGGNKLVHRLVVPQVRHIPNQDGYIHDPFGVKWVGTQLSEEVPSANQKWNSRIYISRADANERRVVNEGEIMEVLAEYGFSREVLSNYSLTEQISMFQQADTVISPHGAGLINLMYSKSVEVTEIFGDYRNGCYYTMSGLDSVSYTCIDAEPAGKDIRLPVRVLSELEVLNSN